MTDITYLYNKYWYSMYLFAMSFLHNKPEAEDIVADIFVGLLSYPTRLKKVEDHIDKYLYWKTKMKCFDLLDKKDTLSLNEDENVRIDEQDTEKLEEIAIKDRVVRSVSNASEFLSPKNKQLFDLLYKDGKSNKEIGDIMHLTDQSVRNAKLRLIQKIKTLLK